MRTILKSVFQTVFSLSSSLHIQLPALLSSVSYPANSHVQELAHSISPTPSKTSLVFLCSLLFVEGISPIQLSGLRTVLNLLLHPLHPKAGGLTPKELLQPSTSFCLQHHPPWSAICILQLDNSYGHLGTFRLFLYLQPQNQCLQCIECAIWLPPENPSIAQIKQTLDFPWWLSAGRIHLLVQEM